MGQVVEIWQPDPGEDAWRAAGPQSAPEPGEDLEPEPDEQVRVWTTDQLRVLIRNLKPYIDGTFGTVSTKHAQVYMSAIRELNKLWRAYYTPPPPPEPEPDEVEQEAVRIEAALATRNRVLDQLQELRNRARS